MEISMSRLDKPNKLPEYRVVVSIVNHDKFTEITLPTRKFAEEVQCFVADVCDAYEKELRSLNEDYERLRNALKEIQKKSA